MKLEQLLAARHPLILAPTVEEDTVWDAVKAAAKETGMALLRWSSVQGLSVDDKVLRKTADPKAAIEFASDSDPDHILVLFGAGQQLERNDVFRRQLFERADARRTITVLVQHDITVPADLKSVATTAEVPLPDAGALSKLARSERPSVIRALQGLTTNEAISALEAARAESAPDEFDLDPTVLVEMKRDTINQSEALELFRAGDLPDVGGLRELKKWLKLRLSCFSALAEEFGLTKPKGVLLAGVPGVGKSLVAKTIGKEWKLPTIRFDLGAVYGGLVGQSEGQMRQALRIVDAMAPCVLFVDEVEKGLGSGGGDGGTSDRVLGSFLTWMQDQRGAFVVATANRVDKLPAEVLRKGRFDEIFFLDLPSAEDRLSILRVHLALKGRDPDEILGTDHDYGEFIDRGLDKFTGAEIEQVVADGLLHAFAGTLNEGDREELALEHLALAAQETRTIASTAKEQIERIREWGNRNARAAS